MGALNFTALVTVTDKDHDGVTLDSLGGGSTLFSVAIQNDVPIANNDYNAAGLNGNQAWWSVTEGGSGIASPDYAATPAGQKTTGNLLINVAHPSGTDLSGADAPFTMTSFTYTNSAGVPGQPGTFDVWMDAQYGALKVSANGDFQYISNPYVNHPLDNFVYESATYTIRDADGDTSSAVFKIKVTDTYSILSPIDPVSIYEANLPSGSAPGVNPTTYDSSITITQGKDPVDVFYEYTSDLLNGVNGKTSPALGGGDLTLFNQLTSNGLALTYTVNPDRRTVTAATTLTSVTVFKLEIVGYSEFGGTPASRFTLYQPLDHIPDFSGVTGTETAPGKIDMVFRVAMNDKNENGLDQMTSDFGISVFNDNILAPNDTLTYDQAADKANTATFDGGSGYDTLLLPAAVSVDFNDPLFPRADRSISDIEYIDLTQSGTNSLSNITATDVIAMTGDHPHILTILGSLGDNVTFSGAADWTKGSVVNGCDVYTYNSNSSIKVNVQTDINDSIVP